MKISIDNQTTSTNNPGLKVGDFLQIRPKESNVMIKFFFVGEKKDEYFAIARSESSKSSNIAFSPEREIIARYLYSNKVYEFKSKIIKTVAEPINLMLIEPPDSCHLHELRSIKRINCSVSTRIELKSETEIKGVQGVIKDINKQGCRCLFMLSDTTKNIFKNNEEFLLTFQFPGIKGIQELPGRIKNIQTAEDKVSVSVGIEFCSHQCWAPPYQ